MKNEELSFLNPSHLTFINSIDHDVKCKIYENVNVKSNNSFKHYLNTLDLMPYNFLLKTILFNGNLSWYTRDSLKSLHSLPYKIKALKLYYKNKISIVSTIYIIRLIFLSHLKNYKYIIKNFSLNLRYFKKITAYSNDLPISFFSVIQNYIYMFICFLYSYSIFLFLHFRLKKSFYYPYQLGVNIISIFFTCLCLFKLKIYMKLLHLDTVNLYCTPNRPILHLLDYLTLNTNIKINVILTKPIFNGVIGYDFNFIKYLNQIYFHIFHKSSYNCLIKNGIHSSSINFNSFNHRSKIGPSRKIFLLFLLTPYTDINNKITKYINFTSDHFPNCLISYKTHPLQSEYTHDYNLDLLKIEDDSQLLEISDTYFLKYSVSPFSSMSFKLLAFDFVPVWLLNISSSPVVFNNAIDTYGIKCNSLNNLGEIIDQHYV